MSDQFPNAVEELFHQVVSLPPEDRAEFLDRHCSSGAVRREVEALLEYDRIEESESRDGRPLNELAPTVDLRQAASRVGKRQQVSSSGLSNSIEHGQFLPGHVLADRYRIVGLLGKGGMGEVYRADDLELGQSVALKLLPRRFAHDAQALQRFRAEVRLARQVSHPNVSRVYDIGLANDLWFLSMEYVDGEDLAHLLPRIGRFSHERATELARQLCLGLHAAHEQGVLHRDLKPANVMIDGRGKLLITDFGLAVVASEVREEDIRSGTPAYMSPEQLAGREVTERSDIYSLGILLHEIYTGQPAWQAKTMAELHAQRQSSPTPTPSSHVDDLDPKIDRVISQCLDPDPAKRPASVINLLAALPGGDPVQAALAAGKTPSPEMVAASGDEGGLPLPLGGALLAVACLLSLAVPMILDWRGHYRWGDLREFEPAVLKKSSIDLVRSIGVVDPPASTAHGFQLTESNGFEYWYRQSSDSLEPEIPDLYLSTFHWQVTPTNPAPTTPGMITVRLDSSGRLIRLLRVPDPNFKSNSEKAADWTKCFEQIGLEQNGYLEIDESELERQFRPPFFADQISVWESKQNDGDKTRLVLAARDDQLVYFNRLGSLAYDRDELPGSRIGRSGFWYLAIIFALSLAWGNLKRGEADIRGATRLAVYFLVVDLLLWFCVLDNCGGLASLWTLGINVLMRGLSVSLRIWLYYVGFEPYVRRFWPRSLIASSRLLAGNLTDRLVGREILIGCVAGSFVACFWSAIGINVLGRLASVMNDGTQAMAVVFESNRSGLGIMLMLLIVITGFRLILRRNWLVITCWLPVATFVFVDVNDARILGFTLAALIDIFLVMRVGFLAAVAARFALFLLILAPITWQVADWYSRSGLVAMLVALALAAYGFYICVRPRPSKSPTRRAGT